MGDMSLLGGEGPYCISVLWGLTALLFVVLIIRIYTRVVCVASYGIDDTFFVITIVSQGLSYLPQTNRLEMEMTLLLTTKKTK